MLISVRRIAATIVPLSRFPPDLSQSRRVLPLLPHSSLTTDQNPKSALETLKDHGFADAQIDAIARRAPWILRARSGDLIGARMSYLCRELGLDRSELVKIVTSNPDIVRSSLENTIIPSIEYLESVLGSRYCVARAIVHAPWLLRPAHSKVAANVSVLRESGVPDSSISKLLLTQPRTFMCRPERFRALLDYVLSAEFKPKTLMFVHAIHVKSAMSSSTWEKKMGVYLSFGWSAEEAELAFRRWPFLYAYSEERLRKQLDFTTNVLKMRPASLLAYTKILTCNLDGTLIPRCCVLNVLMGKGLVKKDMNVPVALSRTRQQFASLFVDKYRDAAPEVLDAYKGKMRFSGFDS